MRLLEIVSLCWLATGCGDQRASSTDVDGLDDNVPDAGPGGRPDASAGGPDGALADPDARPDDPDARPDDPDARPAEIVPLHLTFSGSSIGAAWAYADNQFLGSCMGACDLDVPVGSLVRVAAATPSAFGGFSGACVSATPSCQFTASAHDTLDVEFERRPGERFSVLIDDAAPVQSTSFTTDAALVLGTDAGLYMLDATGAERWVRADLPGHATVTPAGDIIVASGADLVKVDADGLDVWSVPVAAMGPCDEESRMARWLVATPAGGAIIYNGGVRLFDADGALAWSRAIESPICHLAAAVAPDGTVHVGSADEDSGGEGTDLERFSSAGVRLPTLDYVTGQSWFSVDISDDGEIAASATGHEYLGVYRYDAAGTQVGSWEIDTGLTPNRENGIATGPGGIMTSANPIDAGGALEGVTLTTLARNGSELAARQIDYVTAFDLEHDVDGALAVGGWWGEEDGNFPYLGWVTVFEPLAP